MVMSNGQDVAPISTSTKVVIVSSQARRGSPLTGEHETTTLDGGGTYDQVIVSVTYCGSCGGLVRDLENIVGVGGICQESVLDARCRETSKCSNPDCGVLLCRHCRTLVGSRLFCREHGKAQIMGRIIAALFLAVILGAPLVLLVRFLIYQMA